MRSGFTALALALALGCGAPAAAQDANQEADQREVLDLFAEQLDLSATVLDLTFRVEDLDGGIATLDQSADDLAVTEEEITLLERQLEERDVQILTLEDELAGAERELQSVRRQLEERDVLIVALEDSLAGAESNLEALRRQLSERDAQIATLEGSLAQAQSLLQLADASCQARIEHGEAQVVRQLGEFERQLAGARDAIAGRDARIAELETGRAQTGRDLDAARARMGDFEQELGRLRQANTTLSEERDRCLIEAAATDLRVDDRGDELRIELLGHVLFDFNQAVIRAEALSTLKQVANVIRPYAEATIVIEGHTDSHGSDAYNLRLSAERAASVKAWLVQNAGFEAAGIETTGLGAARPVAPNANPDGSDNPEGRQMNRRVEIIVQK
jgi:outer membrane protein OmpA-like peptidoglycan-associated protein